MRVNTIEQPEVGANSSYNNPQRIGIRAQSADTMVSSPFHLFISHVQGYHSQPPRRSHITYIVTLRVTYPYSDDIRHHVV